MNKKFRNRFLALVCLLAFVGVGILYYTNWVVQKPFAVILFVADNLTSSTLTAARIYGGGADSRLSIERFPMVGLVSGGSADSAVPDLAAASMAVASGRRTNHRSLGLSPEGREVRTLVDIARDRGRSVGLVADTALADAGPAAYYARTTDSFDRHGIAVQLLDSPGFDVILGGGASDFVPVHKGGSREDGRDLTMELRQAGYDIVRTKSELESTPTWLTPRVVGLFAEGNLAFADDIQQAAAQPGLPDMVRQAIQLLQINPKGYLLVVDAGLTGRAATQNEGERMLREFLQLDAAVATALAYAGENSVIVVVGRRSVGGLRMNGFPFRQDKGLAVVGTNPRGYPSITWSTGPGSRFDPAGEEGAQPAEPSAFSAPAAIAVAEDGIIVGVGVKPGTIAPFSHTTDVLGVLDKQL
jgi:alkaline phosphatase